MTATTDTNGIAVLGPLTPGVRRSELDEHAQEIYAAEIDVRLSMKGRGKEGFLHEIRASLGKISGITTTVGQPISHRVDRQSTRLRPGHRDSAGIVEGSS